MKRRTLTEIYADAPPAPRKRARVLRFVSFMAMGIIPAIMIGDFLTGDTVQAIIEAALIITIFASWRILMAGRYALAASLVVISAYVALLGIAFASSIPNVLVLFRNALYLAVPLALAAFFFDSGSLRLIIAAGNEAATFAYLFLFILPAGVEIIATDLIVVAFLQAIVALLLIKAGDMNREARSRLETAGKAAEHRSRA